MKERDEKIQKIMMKMGEVNVEKRIKNMEVSNYLET